MAKKDKALLVKISKLISEQEGAGVFQEENGTISFNGLNQETYDEYRRRNKKQIKDVRQAEYGEFLEILDTEFINRNGIDKVPDKYLPMVADMSWNSGPGNAARTLQRTVGADEDGVIGPKTIKALEKYETENDLIDGFSNSRNEFLLNSESPSVIKNRAGLLNRVENVRQFYKKQQPSSDVIVEE